MPSKAAQSPKTRSRTKKAVAPKKPITGFIFAKNDVVEVKPADFESEVRKMCSRHVRAYMYYNGHFAIYDHRKSGDPAKKPWNNPTCYAVVRSLAKSHPHCGIKIPA